MHLKLANQAGFNTLDQIGCVQHPVVRAAKQKSSFWLASTSVCSL